jgi:putative (di)nucleoside polyphosphate hydrolase
MMSESTSLPSNVFRASAGAIITNADGKVLALERMRIKGAWQMPQGGLKENEEPLDAALSEVQEETGLAAIDIQLLAEYPEWLAYELPKDTRSGKYGRGQVQKWFLFRLTSSEEKISLDQHDVQEFSSWKWTTLRELAKVTAPFRQRIYEKLANGFSQYLAE